MRAKVVFVDGTEYEGELRTVPVGVKLEMDERRQVSWDKIQSFEPFHLPTIHRVQGPGLRPTLNQSVWLQDADPSTVIVSYDSQGWILVDVPGDEGACVWVDTGGVVQHGPTGP